MRRTDREVTDLHQIKAILDSCQHACYALWDGEEPYAVIMNFGYEFSSEGLLKLYSHGAKEGRKAEIIRDKCDKAAAIMKCGDRVVLNADEPCQSGSAFESVMAGGRMRILEGEEARHALEVFYKHQAGVVPEFSDEALKRVNVFCLDCETFSAKKCVK